MGSSWAWNFTQGPATRYMHEEDMRDIPYPATELGIHIGFKMWEAGSMIGGFIVAPLWHYFGKKTLWTKRKLRHRIGIAGRRGAFIGVLLTPVMEYAFIKAKKVDEKGLYDRCYRLRYNKKQLLVDRTVVATTFIGWLGWRWTGVVIGTNYAVIAAAIYNAFLFERLRNYKFLGGDMMDKPDEDYKERKV